MSPKDAPAGKYSFPPSSINVSHVDGWRKVLVSAHRHIGFCTVVTCCPLPEPLVLRRLPVVLARHDYYGALRDLIYQFSLRASGSLLLPGASIRVLVFTFDVAATRSLSSKFLFFLWLLLLHTLLISIRVPSRHISSVSFILTPLPTNPPRRFTAPLSCSEGPTAGSFSPCHHLLYDPSALQFYSAFVLVGRT